MTRRLTPALALGALAACATAVSGGKEPFPGARPAPQPAAAAAAPAAPPAAELPGAPAPSDLANPRAYAARFPRPELCEAAARAAQTTSRDKAWEVLRACVDKGTFTPIRKLLDGGWDPELQAKADAATLLAKVVAARGGDVLGDLNLLRQRRIPIFGIGPAAGHPDVYSGRLVMLRARVDDVKTEKGKTTVRLAEFALSGQVSYVEGDTRRVSRSRSTDRERGSGKAEIETSRYGSGKLKGSYERERSRSGESVDTTERRRTDNVPQETGLEALARLTRPDPFFEPGRQFVVLGRFDGVREVAVEGEDEEKVDRLPVLSVIAYVEPSAHIVE